VVLAIEGAVLNFPAWSPDGSRIAFSMTAAGSDDPWTIHVLHRDGTLVHLSPSDVYDVAPSWSPDGGRIAFQSRSFPNGNDEIYVMNADGTNRMRLTHGQAHARPGFPAWSPDGARIAYSWTDVSTAGHVTGIYAMIPGVTVAATD
jgi:Tol biopolymer transport system component